MVHYNDSASAQFLKQWNDSKNYIEVNTSGSTGSPKKIQLQKRDLIISAEQTCHYFNLNSNSIMVCPLSADYIAGKMMIVRALISGAELFIENPSNQPAITKYPDIDLIPIVPSQLQGLIDSSKHNNFKNIIIGGAPLNTMQERLIVDNKLNAYATYGMTETCSHVALRNITITPSLYNALPGFTFEVDSRSCLIINSDKMSFKHLVTNDVVEIKNNTQFEWKGRFDNVVISGGLKAYPEQIEAKLAPLIGRNFYLKKYSDEKWGERIALIIEGVEFNTTSLSKKLANILKPHERPGMIVFKSAFDYTPSGKVKRL